MVNDIALYKQKERLDESASDAKSIQYLLQAYLNPNSLDDEIQEFFREIAALKHKSLQDTLKEMEQGTQKYLEAIDMEISFKNDIPNNIERYVDKIKKLTAQTFLKQAKLTPVKQPKLSSFLKHLGQTPEEQIKNNQAAMNWTQERLQAIQAKWNGDLS